MLSYHAVNAGSPIFPLILVLLPDFLLQTLGYIRYMMLLLGQHGHDPQMVERLMNKYRWAEYRLATKEV